MQRIISLMSAILMAVLVGSIWAQPVGGFETRDQLLDTLEHADTTIDRLSAKILYEREFALAGDIQTRLGRVSFVRRAGEDGQIRRAFAVVFDTTIIGDRSEPDGRTFVFDGQLLIERIPEQRLILRRQVAPPGSKFDPLRIGEGPLPLPLGQRKTDILSNYDTEMLAPELGLEEREDLIKFTAGCAQLRLIPNEARAPEDDFVEIRLWYKQMDGNLLPRMAMTENKTGDVVVVRLWDVKLNDLAEVDPADFDGSVPEGWEVDDQPYRGAMAEPSRLIPISLYSYVLMESQPIAEAGEPQPEFTMPESVRLLIEAPYTDAEAAADLRVFHGFWTRDDLNTPARRAEAALMRGDYSDPALNDEHAPIELRAEATIRRGDIKQGLKLLNGNDSYNAIRLRVMGLEALGEHEQAGQATQAAVDRLIENRADNAADLTAGIDTLIARAKLVGQERTDGTDFQTLMALLTRAHGELDQLYWPAVLTEAKLLYDKDERASAHEAATDVLRLNPACAEAWKLLGYLAVDSFDFDRAEDIANRLDYLAEVEVPEWVEGRTGLTHRSALGALVLAKARIRQDDSDEAVRILEDARKLYPKHRGLLAMQAAAEASRYDMDRAQQLLDELDQLSPGTELGYLRVGWALSERRQYAPAAEALTEAMRRQPKLPEPAILLGLLELQSGRDLEALSALRTVAELDPFNTRASNSLKLLEEIVTYDTIESEHFKVRYKPGIDEILAREMPEALERIHARVCGQADGGIDFEPLQKTVIELMPDHEWFAVRIAGMPALHTIAASTGPVIAMEVPRTGAGHKVGVYDWQRVIQHEYTHTATLARTKNRLPHWFTEAAAQHLEDAPRTEQTCRLLVAKLKADELFDLDEINIKFTRPEQPTDRAQAYAQGLWMYEYMIERFGDAAPLALMDAYAQGRTEAEAMPSELGISSDQFFDDFKQWAGEQVIQWGLAPPAGDPSIAELFARDGLSAEPTTQDYDRWMQEFPDNAVLVERWARLMVPDGVDILDDTSAEALERWAEAVPVAEKPHTILARYYLNSEDSTEQDRAIGHLEFLDARAQYTPAYAAALAKRCAERGEHDKALAKALRAVEIAPYDADQRELAARVALVAKRFAIAARQLDALTKIEPDRPIHKRRFERMQEIIKLQQK